MTEPSDAAPDPGRVAAVVLAGGTAARMDGADKAAIELRGVTLLERTLSATFTAVEVVVVGDPVPTTRPVTFTVEDPRGGGPAAGLLAGLRAFYRLVHATAAAVAAVRSGGDPLPAAALTELAAGHRWPARPTWSWCWPSTCRASGPAPSPDSPTRCWPR